MTTSSQRSSSPFEFVRGGKLDNPYFSSPNSCSNTHVAAQTYDAPSINNTLIEALSTWADTNLVAPDDADIAWSRANDVPEPPRGRSKERGWRGLVQRAKHAMKRSTY
ncbi:hypothetical protein RSOL_413190 [Rhizoctonia solani AG-3 Rhs1AP]|uniref:Uncharacterized protein n=2 Tax=Rhizoctonia solani AG-3 TaxID=1086053 RepID=A0A074S8C1_9AGAM|nr:hypothetical protein RSOL_413190 [Rhizoctonia solani AG-3 Rhs1AP]KEP53850.1 hypothetical protein V565_025260 [Rhizoctonia solani 123E]